MRGKANTYCLVHSDISPPQGNAERALILLFSALSRPPSLMATRHPPTLSEALKIHRSPWNPTDHKTNVFYQLVKAFYSPSFRFHLPRISQSGLHTCINDIAEVEKLEFLGDGAIGDSVGDIVTQLRPNGSPHIYTVRQHPKYMN